MNEPSDDEHPLSTEETATASGGARRQCFSLLQTRRFGLPVATSTVALCPSMDLLTLSLQQPTNHQANGGSKLGSGVNASAAAAASPIAPLWLHRSLSFQKLATITNDTNDDDEEEEEERNDAGGQGSTTANKLTGNTATVWRPDGRWLAVADSKGRLTLFHVEALVKEANISSSTVFPASSSSVVSFSRPTKRNLSRPCSYKTAMSGNAVRIQLSCAAKTSNNVCGLAWSHIGEWHPFLRKQDIMKEENGYDDDEEEEADATYLFAKVRQRYADRSSMLLPASEYYPQYNGGGYNVSGSHLQVHHNNEGSRNTMMGGSSASSVVPNSQAPLSILAVALGDGSIELYAAGRYRIASDLKFHTLSNTPVSRVQMASSNDLSHFLVIAQCDKSDTSSKTTTTTSTLCYSLFSIPTFAEQRYTLQTLTALYSSIMGHLHALPSLLTDVIESWKSSLKPLDTKLDSLSRLLRNYGLLPDTAEGDEPPTSYIRKQLVRYILSGHTAGSADLSNAMDQFFTGVQMNDQLIQRMERSLTVAIANVESLLRKAIAAAQALTLESDELRGLALSSHELIPSLQAAELQEHCQTLLIVMESALTSLIDARFRFRDWIAWLRATGSQIKARGTASNSVQRENAKKRRVPDDTIRRILRYLQEDFDSQNLRSSSGKALVNDSSPSEDLLGIDVCQHWSTKLRLLRPTSPQSVLATNSSSKLASSIPAAYRNAAEIAHRLFELPSQAINRCFRRFDFELTSHQGQEAAIAITTRLGAGGLDVEGWSFGESPPTGFFDPQVRDNDVLDVSKRRSFRQWALSAQATSKAGQHSSLIEIRAVPLPWYKVCTTHQWDDSERHEELATFYMQVILQLPPNCFVHEVAFYGDNGKSGLFAGSDNGACTERRQALAALVGSQSDDCYSMELWLIDYERVPWDLGELCLRSGGDKEEVSFAPIPSSGITKLRPMEKGYDEDDEDDEDPAVSGYIRCKTRQLSSFNSDLSARKTHMVLSGSRGIAAVASSGALPMGSHLLEVIDLEEDEEEEEEDDADQNMDDN
ncbi:hypothetical protein ACA910_006350 [Epithemia clementina (nom. ined.)]